MHGPDLQAVASVISTLKHSSVVLSDPESGEVVAVDGQSSSKDGQSDLL